MDSQISRPHGHSYDQETPNAGPHAGDVDHEHHEKKSVLKKVKAKAKKIKDTLIHSHGHNHDQEEDHMRHVPDDHDLDEEDDEDEEMFDGPQIHGTSPVFASAAASDSSVPGQVEKSTARQDDYSGDTQTRVTDPMKSFVPGQEEVPIGKTSNVKEIPYTPLNTPASIAPGIVEQTKVTDPIRTFTPEQEAIRGKPEVIFGMTTGLEEDPHPPKDRSEDYTPSNYQTKVTDPTGAHGEEVGITPILRSLDKMNLSNEPKPRAEENLPSRPHDQSIFPTGSHGQFSPEPTPPIPISSPDTSRSISDTPDASKQGSYTEKISSATYPVADKAISAKDIVASKLGYNEKDSNKEHEMYEGEEEHNTKPTSSTVEYGKKIAATVTEKLTPVYEKVAETSSTVFSKVPGIRGSTGNEGESNVGGQEKGISAKDYFADKLKPGEEDRALSEVISEALHRQRTEKPIGKVTESEEVQRRLGSSEGNLEESVDQSSMRGVMVDKIKEAVGSWFGKGSQQSPGSFTGTTSEEETSGIRKLSNI